MHDQLGKYTTLDCSINNQLKEKQKLELQKPIAPTPTILTHWQEAEVPTLVDCKNDLILSF